MKLSSKTRRETESEALDEDIRQRFGEAFGKIEQAQGSLPAVDTQLIRYLLDMAKVEIARRVSGLPHASLGEKGDSTAAWLKALRDEEAEGQPDRSKAN